MRVKVDMGGGALLQADLPTGPGMGGPGPEPGAAVHLHWDERAVHALA
jgi:hypothetical protein